MCFCHSACKISAFFLFGKDFNTHFSLWHNKFRIYGI